MSSDLKCQQQQNQQQSQEFQMLQHAAAVAQQQHQHHVQQQIRYSNDYPLVTVSAEYLTNLNQSNSTLQQIKLNLAIIRQTGTNSFVDQCPGKLASRYIQYCDKLQFGNMLPKGCAIKSQLQDHNGALNSAKDGLTNCFLVFKQSYELCKQEIVTQIEQNKKLSKIAEKKLKDQYSQKSDNTPNNLYENSISSEYGVMNNKQPSYDPLSKNATASAALFKQHTQQQQQKKKSSNRSVTTSKSPLVDSSKRQRIGGMPSPQQNQRGISGPKVGKYGAAYSFQESPLRNSTQAEFRAASSTEGRKGALNRNINLSNKSRREGSSRLSSANSSKLRFHMSGSEGDQSSLERIHTFNLKTETAKSDDEGGESSSNKLKKGQNNTDKKGSVKTIKQLLSLKSLNNKPIENNSSIDSQNSKQTHHQSQTQQQQQELLLQSLSTRGNLTSIKGNNRSKIPTDPDGDATAFNSKSSLKTVHHQCYVEEQAKMREQFMIEAFKILKSLNRNINKFQAYAALNLKSDSGVLNQLQNQMGSILGGVIPNKIKKNSKGEMKKPERKTKNTNLKKSFVSMVEINTLRKNERYKQIGRNLLGVKKYDDWINNLEIGNVMHLNPIAPLELQSNIGKHHEFQKDPMLKKLVLLAVAFFSIATEMRMMVQFNEIPGGANQSVNERSRQKEELQVQSELWHAQSVFFGAYYLPQNCPMITHISNSYNKHYIGPRLKKLELARKLNADDINFNKNATNNIMGKHKSLESILTDQSRIDFLNDDSEDIEEGEDIEDNDQDGDCSIIQFEDQQAVQSLISKGQMEGGTTTSSSVHKHSYQSSNEEKKARLGQSTNNKQQLNQHHFNFAPSTQPQNSASTSQKTGKLLDQVRSHILPVAKRDVSSSNDTHITKSGINHTTSALQQQQQQQAHYEQLANFIKDSGMTPQRQRTAKNVGNSNNTLVRASATTYQQLHSGGGGGGGGTQDKQSFLKEATKTLAARSKQPASNSALKISSANSITRSFYKSSTTGANHPKQIIRENKLDSKVLQRNSREPRSNEKHISIDILSDSEISRIGTSSGGHNMSDLSSIVQQQHQFNPNHPSLFSTTTTTSNLHHQHQAPGTLTVPQSTKNAKTSKLTMKLVPQSMGHNNNNVNRVNLNPPSQMKRSFVMGGGTHPHEERSHASPLPTQGGSNLTTATTAHHYINIANPKQSLNNSSRLAVNSTRSGIPKSTQQRDKHPASTSNQLLRKEKATTLAGGAKKQNLSAQKINNRSSASGERSNLSASRGSVADEARGVGLPTGQRQRSVNKKELMQKMVKNLINKTSGVVYQNASSSRNSKANGKALGAGIDSSTDELNFNQVLESGQIQKMQSGINFNRTPRMMDLDANIPYHHNMF